MALRTPTTTGTLNASDGTKWNGGTPLANGDEVNVNTAATLVIDTPIRLGRSGPGAPLTAPAQTATGGGTTGGALAAGTYKISYTWVDTNGVESTLGPEPSGTITVASGNVPRVTIPAAPSGVASANVYISGSGGSFNTQGLYAVGVPPGGTFDLSAAPVGGSVPNGALRLNHASAKVTTPALLTLAGDLICANLVSSTKTTCVTIGDGTGAGGIRFDATGAVAPTATHYKLQTQVTFSQHTRTIIQGPLSSNTTGGAATGYVTNSGLTQGSSLQILAGASLTDIDDGTGTAILMALLPSGAELIASGQVAVTRCGDIDASGGVANANATVSLAGLKFSASTGTQNVAVRGNPAATGTYLVKGCVFDKRPMWWNMKGLTNGTPAEPNYYHQAFHFNGSTGLTGLTHCFFVRRIQSLGGNFNMNGDVLGGSLWFEDGSPGWTDVNTPTWSNPHALICDGAASAQTFDDVIFLSAGVDGTNEAIMSPTAPSSGLHDYTWSHIVTTPDMLDPRRRSGCFTHFGQGNNANHRVTGHHNTLYSGTGVVGENNAFAIAETGTGGAGSVPKWNNCIGWSHVANRAWIIRQSGSTPTAAAGFVAKADYNGAWNLSSAFTLSGATPAAPGYDAAQAVFKDTGGTQYTPGVHDVYGDPGYPDPFRNLLTWFYGEGGTNTGDKVADIASALAYVQAHWQDANYGGVSGQTVLASIRAHIRSGITPTNAAFQVTDPDDTDTAITQGWIGAVAGQSSATTGSGSSTFAGLGGSGNGTETMRGTGTSTFAGLGGTGTLRETLLGSGASVFAGLGGSGSGAIGTPAVTGAGTSTLAGLGGSGALREAMRGAGVSRFAGVGGVGTGQTGATSVTGSGASTFAGLGGTGTGHTPVRYGAFRFTDRSRPRITLTDRSLS